MHGMRAAPPARLALAGGCALLAGARASVRPMPGRVACRMTVAERGHWQFLSRWFAARVAAPAGVAAPRGVAAVVRWAPDAGAACAV